MENTSANGAHGGGVGQDGRTESTAVGQQANSSPREAAAKDTEPSTSAQIVSTGNDTRFVILGLLVRKNPTPNVAADATRAPAAQSRMRQANRQNRANHQHPSIHRHRPKSHLPMMWLWNLLLLPSPRPRTCTATASATCCMSKIWASCSERKRCVYCCNRCAYTPA